MLKNTLADSRASLQDTNARAYRYDSGDLQALFSGIIESLGSPDATDTSIERILDDVCKHFKFGCGFVYEADHTNTLFLKERYAGYHTPLLPNKFKLDKHLDAADVQTLLRTSVFYHHNTPDDRGRKTIFDSNTIMMVPVLDKNKAAVGLIGMMDRRRSILLDEQAVGAAKMVLNLLANSVKLRLVQRNLKYAEQSLISILDNTGVDIYVNDFHTHELLYVNRSMATPYGGLEKVLGKKCWATFYTDKTGPCNHCPQPKLLDADGNPTRRHTWDFCRPFDRSWFRVFSSAFHWVDGRLAHVVSSVDITDSKNSEFTIAKMANYDSLTGLPNRRKLLADWQQLLAGEHAARGFVFFFDLDRFKALNDSVGHQVGDELLCAVGKALQSSPLTKNRVYRYGGDEFVVLLDNVNREYARTMAIFLLERFNSPWKLQAGVTPVCRASIGVAEYPANGMSPETLLHTADTLMYTAKRRGRGIACFHDGEIIGSSG